MWMWEPAGAMALSIFLTMALFLSVYGLAYLIVAGFFNKIDKENNKRKRRRLIFVN